MVAFDINRLTKEKFELIDVTMNLRNATLGTRHELNILLQIHACKTQYSSLMFDQSKDINSIDDCYYHT
jgi:hypothetical protein